MTDNKKETKSRYPKSIQVIAMVGIILLLALYIITLIAALTTSPRAAGLFKACLGASILLPIVLWGYLRIAILLTPKKDKGEDNV